MPANTTEREVLAMFIGPNGCEIVYGDPKPPPPKRTRKDELRTALAHVRQAIAALRRAIKTA
jgi:hypothetical protein